MNVNANGKAILGSTKALSLQWELTKGSWHDSKAQDFESDYILPLDTTVMRAAGALEKLDGIISQLRHDCE